MSEQFSRTARLIGAANIEKLAHSHVCLFGVGGVGGYVAEALARSGVGYIDLVDHDQICLSNINRQIIATHRTLGRGDEAADACLDLQHPGNRVGQLHPRVAVPTGQRTVGQRFSAPIDWPRQAGQPGNAAAHGVGMSFRRHLLAHWR